MECVCDDDNSFIQHNNRSMTTLQTELKKVEDEMNNVAGSWSGDDTTFMHEDSILSEDHAHAATEIAEKAKELGKLLVEYEEL